jgi:hypothetical protein
MSDLRQRECHECQAPQYHFGPSSSVCWLRATFHPSSSRIRVQAP